MKPFNLEAAKRGEPLVTRDGKKAKFIGYAEEAEYPVIVHIDGYSNVSIIDGQGKVFSPMEDSPNDIFMVSKKRTVWINLYPSGVAYHYHSEDKAAKEADTSRIGGCAWPLKIEE